MKNETANNTPKHFDAIVIGGGQGNGLARKLAEAGFQTVLIEREYIGGTCANWGCTPTKALVSSAHVAHQARRGGEFGIEIGNVETDFARVQKRQRDIVLDFRREAEERLASTRNLSLIYGEARFVSVDAICVTDSDGAETLLSAPHIVIATGAKNHAPPVNGLENIASLDSRAMLFLEELPSHLLILGGGVIACEYSQMMRRFGAKVTVVEESERLLSREDEEISREVEGVFLAEDIAVLTKSKATRVEKDGDETALHLQTAGGEKIVRGSHLMVATGRVPQTDALNLQAAGVEIEGDGTVKVDAQLRTNVSGIYAMGDVCGSAPFTHIAYDDARILFANIAHGEKRDITERLVAYTVFTDPQLGRVGLSESEAREKKLDFRVATLKMSDTARGVETGETNGLWKALVDRKTDLILGASLLSAEGGETVAVVQVAMMAKLPFTALRDMPLSHPTWAESLNNLFLKLE